MSKYTAIIVEPRKHNALPFVLKNFLENLNNDWSFIIFHGINNQEYIENIINTNLVNEKDRIQLINLNVNNLSNEEYNNLLKDPKFYDNIPTETFLIFQVDTLILKENKDLINEFLEYDYVGAPWTDRIVGNGGLSLRKKSKMLEILNKMTPFTFLYKNEDEYFTRQNIVKINTPTFEKAKQFSVETVFYDYPFGVHNCYHHLSQQSWNYLSNKYNDLQILKNLNTIIMDKEKQSFTIVYKTYKNDLEWLKYSLLSLKKFLDPSNILELIIYTHDIVYGEVCCLLDNIQMKHFINFRVIPVAYNYHGYVKQMVVKASCYKDVQTKYVILLDSDLLLKKKINFESFIKEDGKIEWKYLKIEHDPSNPVFRVWKKACEDSNKSPKNIHYMSNGFPFIFTRNSLEGAALKFIEMHNCDYDDYCCNRTNHEQIRVEDSTTQVFDRLSKVFTEFEYLGYYCHNFSNDYIFSPTPYCKMDAQLQKDNPDSYFIQNWSHGGINYETLQKINLILQV